MHLEVMRRLRHRNRSSRRTAAQAIRRSEEQVDDPRAGIGQFVDRAKQLMTMVITLNAAAM